MLPPCSPCSDRFAGTGAASGARRSRSTTLCPNRTRTPRRSSSCGNSRDCRSSRPPRRQRLESGSRTTNIPSPLRRRDMACRLTCLSRNGSATGPPSRQNAGLRRPRTQDDVASRSGITALSPIRLVSGWNTMVSTSCGSRLHAGSAATNDGTVRSGSEFVDMGRFDAFYSFPRTFSGGSSGKTTRLTSSRKKSLAAGGKSALFLLYHNDTELEKQYQQGEHHDPADGTAR